jgi:hypothetical protein
MLRENLPGELLGEMEELGSQEKCPRNWAPRRNVLGETSWEKYPGRNIPGKLGSPGEMS